MHVTKQSHNSYINNYITLWGYLVLMERQKPEERVIEKVAEQITGQIR